MNNNKRALNIWYPSRRWRCGVMKKWRELPHLVLCNLGICVNSHYQLGSHCLCLSQSQMKNKDVTFFSSFNSRFPSVFFRWLLHLKQGLHLSERIGVAKVNHVVAAITPNLHLRICHSVMSGSFQFFSDWAKTFNIEYFNIGLVPSSGKFLFLSLEWRFSTKKCK